MAGNDIRFKGTRALAEVLKTNRSLMTLDLGREDGGGMGMREGAGWCGGYAGLRVGGR